MPLPRAPIRVGLAVVTMAGLVMPAATSRPAHAQQPGARLDFARDVRPILQEHCYRCHGPEDQKNGFRLDRRSRAYGGVLRPNIIPGSSGTSRVYQRVAGTSAGTRMPPDGPLDADKIETIKVWIDQGAPWPDAVANEIDWPAPDEQATRLTTAIRLHDARTVASILESAPGVINRTGPDGSTPLMYAALYGDAALVAGLLASGADANARNHDGLTPLMWAIEDLEKVTLLLRHGADANAVSDTQRSVLQLAASQRGSAAMVKALLDAGAEAKQPALTAAANYGEIDTVRLLLAAGVVDTGDAFAAAVRQNAMDCANAIVTAQPALRLKNGLATLLPPLGPGHVDMIRAALARGAEVNLAGPTGLMPLMRVAISEVTPAESLKVLLDHGANPAARSPDGNTAFDFAARLGKTPALEVLSPAHGDASAAPNRPLAFVAGNTTRDAVRRSLPPLQRSGIAFYERGGCVSCHSNLLTALVVTAARDRRYTVDETLARREADTLARDVMNTRNLALQGMVVPGGGPTTTGYILLAMRAQGHNADESTDALVRLLRRSQRGDGRWPTAFRPPSESSAITAAAVALRGIQLYGEMKPGSPDRRAVERAVAWLSAERPATTEDRVFRLLGLVWGGAPRDVISAATTELAGTQRPDGGWAQLASLDSDAYATGSAMFALRQAGTATTAAKYRRGVAYLLKTQLQDGSWFVAKRAHPTQVYFDSGFPHGTDQYISAAATNWATLALLLTERAGS